MSKIHTRTFRARWSEQDANGIIAPASYLRYLVETAYDWGDALGLAASDYTRFGLFWLIRETRFDFFRPLRHNDRFNFSIWMVNWQKVRGTRCFEVTHAESGEVIAQGSQNIVSMSIESQRPASPPENIINNFRLEAPRSFPFDKFPKLVAPEAPFTSQRQVAWGDLDELQHVNNATYISYAEEIAAQERAARGWGPSRLAGANLTVETRRLHIQYLSPAVWGETLRIATHALSSHATGESRYVGMTRISDNALVCECILDFEWRDRQSGESRPLQTINNL